MGKQPTCQNDPLQDIYTGLEKIVPETTKVSLQEDVSKVNKVKEYNAIIHTYLKGEHAHLKWQKPVGVIIALAVGAQLLAFNVLIYFVVLRSYSIQELELILEFMKYYTGAVILEMLGMCLIVVKGVFSSSVGRMVEHILKKTK